MTPSLRTESDTILPIDDTKLAELVSAAEDTPQAIMLYLEHTGAKRPEHIFEYLQKHKPSGSSLPRIKKHLSTLYKKDKLLIRIPYKEFSQYSISDPDKRAVYYATKKILKQSENNTLLLNTLETDDLQKQQNALYELYATAYLHQLSPEQLDKLLPVFENKQHMNERGWSKATNILYGYLKEGILPKNIAALKTTLHECLNEAKKISDEQKREALIGDVLVILGLLRDKNFIDELKDTSKDAHLRKLRKDRFNQWIFADVITQYDKELLRGQIEEDSETSEYLSLVRQRASQNMTSWKNNFGKLQPVLDSIKIEGKQ